MAMSTMEILEIARSMVGLGSREIESLGRGVLKYADGGAYEGEWKDGKKHGKFRGLGE